MDPYFKKFTKLFTKKIGRKIINRQYFHRETVFHMKTLSISNFTTSTYQKLLFKWTQKERFYFL